MLSLACVLAITTSLFGACAKKDNSTAQSGNGTAAQAGTKNVSMRFSWWGDDARHKATLAALDAYSQKNPNVKVDAEYMGYDDYNKKLLTQLAGGTAPDLFQFHRDWLPDVQSQGDLLADLGSFSSIDLKQYPDSLLKGSGSYKGKVYLAPASVVALSMTENKDFLAKYGVKEPDAWTWDSFIQAGKAIHQQDKNAYLTTADIDVLNVVFFSSYVSQKTGKSWINDDNTVNVTKADLTDGLQFISDLFSSGTMEPFGDSSMFTGKMDQNPKWVNGQIGALLDVSNAITRYKAAVPGAKFGVTALPVRKDAVMSGNDYSGNMGYSVNNKSANKDEAAKLLNWIINDKDAALTLTTVRGVPATTDGLKALTDAGKLDTDLAKAVDLGQKNSYTINMISSNTELMQIRKDVLQKVIFGKETPDQGADEILKGFDAKLKTLKAK